MTMQVVRMHNPAGDGLVNRNSANAAGLAWLLGTPWGVWEGECKMSMYKVYVKKEKLEKQVMPQGLDGGYFANYVSCNNLGRLGYRCLPINNGDCSFLSTGFVGCTKSQIRTITKRESWTHVGMGVVRGTGKKGRWYSTPKKALELKNWYMDTQYRTAECKHGITAAEIEKAFDSDMQPYFQPMEVDISAFAHNGESLQEADLYSEDQVQPDQSLTLV